MGQIKNIKLHIVTDIKVVRLDNRSRDNLTTNQGRGRSSTKMPQYFQKPENALKRANEFIDIGKKEAALDVLYDVIKSKKHRVWQKIHEPILRTYLGLCVDLKRSV